MDKSYDYAAPHDECSLELDLVESVPLNTQANREAIDRIETQISASTFEQRDICEKILETLERHCALLESIDHALHYKKSAETVWLGRIFWLILVAVCSHFVLVVFDFL